MPSPGLVAAIVPLARRVLDWSALSFALNLVWEIGQLPLYAIFRTEPLGQIAYAVTSIPANLLPRATPDSDACHSIVINRDVSRLQTKRKFEL